MKQFGAQPLLDFADMFCWHRRRHIADFGRRGKTSGLNYPDEHLHACQFIRHSTPGGFECHNPQPVFPCLALSDNGHSRVVGTRCNGVIMPILRFEMHPGKTLEQKRELVHGITRVVVETLACPPEVVEIIITEIPKDSWSVAGKLKSET